MKIGNNSVVSFHYRLHEQDGELLEETGDGPASVYLHGHGDMLPALEEAIAGHQKGDSFEVSLSPWQAYGERREDSVQRISIKRIRDRRNLKPGMPIVLDVQGGRQRHVTVVKVGRFNVDVDTNHPFAGKTLVFNITIEDVREAEQAEIAHGHVHGPGGHQHD